MGFSAVFFFVWTCVEISVGEQQVLSVFSEAEADNLSYYGVQEFVERLSDFLLFPPFPPSFLCVLLG
jgi:hypothetical protein